MSIHTFYAGTDHDLSLDTLDPFKFELMTRRMGHDAVLRSLEMAIASPALETKLNAVVVKGLNDHEVSDFVELTRSKPLSVRFIEFMPFTGMRCLSSTASPKSHPYYYQETNGIQQRWSRRPICLNELVPNTQMSPRHPIL
jgi:molybdenum cofactor biosynthesis enzyme MoaA